MKRRSEGKISWENNVNKIVGLGGKSIRKSYFPELKEKIASLDLQNVFYQSILNSIPDSVVITDSSGIITQVNPALIKRFGYTAEELTGKHISILYADETDHFHVNPVWTEAVLHYRCKDGALLVGETHGNDMHDKNGDLIGHLEVIRDITKKVETLNQQQRLEEQLRKSQKMEAIGSLAGGVAHDFNNILSGIIGYAELIEIFEINDMDDIRYNIREILQASYRARDLVKQILTFSRQDDLDLHPTSITKIAREALQLIRITLPHNITLETKFDTPADSVLADSTKIHQVITNLCTNAIQAMAKVGGTLTLQITEVESDELQLSSNNGAKAKRMLALEIIDTGPGISPEVMDNIFEPYFTTKQPGEGTGFGLSLVHGIVKSHNGHIDVESRLGHGTCFRILLPQSTEQPLEQDDRVKVSTMGGHGHILLVDDELQQLDCGTKFLERLGFTITAQQSSIEAVAAFEQSPSLYDIVITDLTMPEMNGLELAARVRALRPDIPIILCTGFLHTLSREKIKTAGITQIVNKPYKFEELADVLEQVQN
ncbi:ATP-binding protein [Desulforhopalus sp. IMCC35007]|uniref:hybrid sensor histidine kinase/response regulator n=1 Tax=Desulforhopalus sp. IMCC35007 TaxID=2569543 RepID=UPI0010AEAE8A|nr:ATP-binding protein [Desulforhopalus sp. IMCC35007]TKB12335.1 response regulator [Desulforhopalus sp. IMCC35007]